MRAWHVLGQRRVPILQRASHVHGDANVAMEYLDCAIGDACIEQLTDQAKRHGVPVVVYFDVIVDAGPTALPFGVFERFGGQWQQSRLFDRLEQLASAAADTPHGTGVQFIVQFTQRHIELAE